MSISGTNKDRKFIHHDHLLETNKITPLGHIFSIKIFLYTVMGEY